MVYGDQHWHLIVSTGTYDSVPHGGTVFLSQQWAQQLLFIHSIYIKETCCQSHSLNFGVLKLSELSHL